MVMAEGPEVTLPLAIGRGIRIARWRLVLQVQWLEEGVKEPLDREGLDHWGGADSWYIYNY